MLKASIIDPILFVSNDTGKTIAGGDVFETKVPRQYKNLAVFDIATATEDALESAYQISSLGTIIIALCIGVTLKPLWIFKNVMQIVAYFRHLE